MTKEITITKILRKFIINKNHNDMRKYSRKMVIITVINNQTISILIASQGFLPTYLTASLL